MAEQTSGTASGRERPPRFAILKIPNFRYYWGATIFSLVGEHIEVTIRSWLIWELTHSVFWLMMMVFMHWVPHAVLSIPAGSIAERHNRQRIILWSEVVLALAAMGMFITTLIGIMDQYWMSGLLILHSIAGALSNPCRQLFVHDMVGREHLLSGIAMTSSLRFATQSVGKPIGGFILLTFGSAWGFFVNALAFLPIILVLLTVIRLVQREIPRESMSHPYEEFKQGLKHMGRERSILATMAIATASSVFVGSGFDPFMAIYADTVFHMGAKGYTYFITATGVGALVSMVALGWVGNVRWKGKMLFTGVFGYCLSMVAFGLSRSFALSILFLFLFGLFQVIHSASATALLLETVPSNMRGRVMGIYNFGRLGLRVVNGPFFTMVHKFAVWSTATAFASHALTLGIAAATVAVLTLGLGILVPGVSKQE